MEGKKSFVLYADLLEIVEVLSDEQAGLLFKTVLRYVNDKDPEIPKEIQLAFIPIKQSLKRDLEKWKDIRVKRAEAGRKGGLATQSKDKQEEANQANASFDKQNQANQAVNVNDNVNVNVNVTDNTINGQIEDVDQVHLDKKDIILEQYSEWFDMFWKAYPKKKNKKEAQKWFLAKQHKHANGNRYVLDEDLFKVMMDALEFQKGTRAWQKEGGKYIPYPTSWLNGEKWNDEEVQSYFESAAKNEVVWQELGESDEEWAKRAGYTIPQKQDDIPF